MQELLDILLGDRRHAHVAQGWLDVTLDPPLVGVERAGLLGSAADRWQSPSLGVGDILVAQFSDRERLAGLLLIRGRVATLNHLAEQPLGFLAGQVGRPRRTMPPDRVKALAALSRAVEQDVGYALASLPASTEARDSGVPSCLIFLERPHLFQAEPLPVPCHPTPLAS